MTIYVNENGSWLPVVTPYVNDHGTWKQVKSAFVKQAGSWKQIYGSASFTAYALGQNENLTPYANAGLWMNGPNQYDVARSYSLFMFDQFGNVIFAASYDIYADANAQPPVTTNTDNLTNAINGMAPGQLFALISANDASTGHLATNLLAAVKSVGGTDAVYGQPMALRGAYLLLGKVGSPAYLEQYRGIDITEPNGQQGDYNAALVYNFSVLNNEIYGIVEVIGN